MEMELEGQEDSVAMLSLLHEIQRVRSEIRGEGDDGQDVPAGLDDTQDSTAEPAAGEEAAAGEIGDLQHEEGEPDGNVDSVMFLLGQIQQLHASLDATSSADMPRLQRLLRHVGSSSSLASLADEDLLQCSEQGSADASASTGEHAAEHICQ